MGGACEREYYKLLTHRLDLRRYNTREFGDCLRLERVRVSVSTFKGGV